MHAASVRVMTPIDVRYVPVPIWLFRSIRSSASPPEHRSIALLVVAYEYLLYPTPLASPFPFPIVSLPRSVGVTPPSRGCYFYLIFATLRHPYSTL